MKKKKKSSVRRAEDRERERGEEYIRKSTI